MKKLLSLFLVSLVAVILSINLASANEDCKIQITDVEYDKTLEGEIYEQTETRNFEPNIVHYSVSNNSIEYMYLNNSIHTIINTNDSYTSYSQNLNGDGDPECINILENDLVLVNDTTISPYNKIGQISSQSGIYIHKGSAFLMGPNIALTCSHNIYDKNTKNFYNNIKIDFGYNGETYNERVYVTDIYILKLQYDTFTYANDWAICVIDGNYGEEVGYFGKCSGYNLIGLDATIIGYPGGQATHSQYISEGEIVRNNPTFKYYAYVVGGMSGGPVFVTINNHTYVAGINAYTYGNYFAGATRISSFLFDFLNYFLNENLRGAELRDYYYEGITKTRYNTMSELIITPTSNK